MTDAAHRTGSSGGRAQARSPFRLAAACDWRIVVVVLVAASAALHLTWPLPEDPSWLLTVCERMLAGRTLYSDIAELNPPMSPWLYMPVVWLAPKLGVTPEILLVLATIAICLAAIAVSGRILTSAGLLRGQGPWWIVATFALLVAPVLTFAQREHFAVAFALPMLAVIAARAAGRSSPLWASLLAGVCGGLTACLKPHFAAAILAPALYAAFARRSLRPLFGIECLTAGAVFALYLSSAVSLHPEYFTDMLPIAATIYVPNRNPLVFLLTRPFAMLTWLCLVAWLLRRGFRDQPLSMALLASLFGFLAAYLVQGRGWTYHLLPAVTLATIGFGLAAVWPKDAARDAGGRLLWIGSAALAAGFLVMMVGSNVIERERDELPVIRALDEMLRPLGSHLKIAVLSDEVAIGNPLHREIGATLINRGPSLWMTGNALAFCQKDKSEQARQNCDLAIARERAMLIEDLKREPPDVVIAGTDRDWFAWARNDPETAKILDGFRSYGRVEHGPYRVDVLVRAQNAELKLRPSITAVPGF